MGSFHIGGRRLDVQGHPVVMQQLASNGVPARFDPNGGYMVEQMYVQYFIPETRSGSLPLLLWHGGGMTGVNYETTPDGREGWLNLFLRWGWAVYNCDAVERGRAGWPAVPSRLWDSDPMLIPVEQAVERFRMGVADGQFPAQAREQFGKQLTPRWTTTDEPTFRAYLELVERVGPCVILAHSQGGNFAFRVAQARPDLVRALVAVEPAGVGDPGQAAALRDVPILMLYGGYIEQDPRWPQLRQRGLAFAERARSAGGRVDVIDLPALGIEGNSHMLMMERNNGEIAALIRRWLRARALESYDGRNPAV
jgi:pimeloyl-ACP methyl ester carboxylesterase